MVRTEIVGGANFRRAETTIREERPADIEEIRIVNQQAFGRPREGELIDALRANGDVLLSLVAIQDHHVVGHVLYSPVSVTSGSGRVGGAGLGPMAVLPKLQRKGIGAKLIGAGNRMLREKACPFVVVLGHPEYYPRFGFKPASGSGLRCEWNVPDAAFMVLVMDELKMKDVSGLVKYRPEFSEMA